jgi:hypothetical protein
MKGLRLRGRQLAAPQLCGVLLLFPCAVASALIAWPLTACHKIIVADGITVQQQIAPQPVRIGAATVTIHLTDSAAKPVPHASVMIEADMTHPGMSPVFAPSKETSAGVYEAHIDLNMGGDWIVLSHIKLANGHKLERQMDVKGVRAN